MNRFGNIKYLEEWTSPKPGQTPTKADRTVIMLHGYGADAYDLRSLAEVMNTGHNTHWIFPNGPLSVPIGPGWTGSAWWPIDMVRLQAAAAAGNVDFRAEAEPAELPKLREQFLQWIPTVEPDWKKVILAGFSQGSMLACDIFLHAPEAPLGLVLFSSALMNKQVWEAKAPGRAGSRFFQSHGDQDTILPLRVGSQLESLLVQKGGMKGSLFTFKGAHEIPMAAIERANQYMQSL